MNLVNQTNYVDSICAQEWSPWIPFNEMIATGIHVLRRARKIPVSSMCRTLSLSVSLSTHWVAISDSRALRLLCGLATGEAPALQDKPKWLGRGELSRHPRKIALSSKTLADAKQFRERIPPQPQTSIMATKRSTGGSTTSADAAALGQSKERSNSDVNRYDDPTGDDSDENFNNDSDTDSTEEELERLIFGDHDGFQAKLKQHAKAKVAVKSRSETLSSQTGLEAVADDDVCCCLRNF